MIMIDQDTNTSRISELEQQQAATATDIRGIYAGMDEIRNVLVRMQENAKPNLVGLFLAGLFTCTFMVTVGGLALAPAYNGINSNAVDIDKVEQTAMQVIATRFTADQGKGLEDDLREAIKDQAELQRNSRDRVMKLEGIVAEIQNRN